MVVGWASTPVGVVVRGVRGDGAVEVLVEVKYGDGPFVDLLKVD
jgi:hypothetical protein